MAFVVNNTRGAVQPSMMAPPKRGVVFFLVAILLASAVWPAVATRSTGQPAEAPIPVLDVAQLETQMWRLVNHDRTSPKTFAETKGQARRVGFPAGCGRARSL